MEHEQEVFVEGEGKGLRVETVYDGKQVMKVQSITSLDFHRHSPSDLGLRQRLTLKKIHFLQYKPLKNNLIKLNFLKVDRVEASWSGILLKKPPWRGS